MQAFLIISLSGQAGVVNTTANKTIIAVNFNILHHIQRYQVFSKVGSCTLLRAFKISSFVIVQLFVKVFPPAKINP